MEFLPDRNNIYAIGGYLVSHESALLCLLADYKMADSLCEAEIIAMVEVVQFVLEEGACIEFNLELRTPKVLESWIKRVTISTFYSLNLSLPSLSLQNLISQTHS